MRKGQSVLLSHTFLVAFGMIFIFIVMVSFITLNADFRNFVADKELQQACFLVRGGIEKIYNPSSYRPPTESLSGMIVVDMPQRIAGVDYSLVFLERSLSIEAGNRNFTCPVGFDADYTGFSDGGPVELSYFRNFTRDRIELRNR